MIRKTGVLVAMAATMLGAGVAHADLAPPSGWLLDVASVTPTTTAGYVQYSTSFTATNTATVVSFLFRRDPSYFGFDDASVSLGSMGANLLVNPGFELGPLGSQNPVGWGNFQQIPGINAIGYVETGPGRGGETANSGNYYWGDGAVGAYDGIYQSIATVVGQQYTLSFWLSNPVSGNSYSQTGDGIDVLAYVGDNVPDGTTITNPAPPTPGAVPELATWAMMIAGFGMVGFAMRRRQTVRVSYAA